MQLCYHVKGAGRLCCAHGHMMRAVIVLAHDCCSGLTNSVRLAKQRLLPWRRRQLQQHTYCGVCKTAVTAISACASLHADLHRWRGACEPAQAEPTAVQHCRLTAAWLALSRSRSLPCSPRCASCLCVHNNVNIVKSCQVTDALLAASCCWNSSRGAAL